VRRRGGGGTVMKTISHGAAEGTRPSVKRQPSRIQSTRPSSPDEVRRCELEREPPTPAEGSLLEEGTSRDRDRGVRAGGRRRTERPSGAGDRSETRSLRARARSVPAVPMPCTIAETAKPKTRAHHTPRTAMRAAFSIPVRERTSAGLGEAADGPQQLFRLLRLPLALSPEEECAGDAVLYVVVENRERARTLFECGSRRRRAG